MAHRCPTCDKSELDTMATLPYVRGFLIAYQLGTRKFLGCRSCVRRSIFKEVGVSALIGWFSITALIINPFLLTYGVLRGVFLGRNPEAVRQALVAAGIPEDDQGVDVLQVAYGLAAAMIAADGKIEASEIEAATQIGGRLFDGFEVDALMRQLEHYKELPDPGDLARVLSRVLEDADKVAVYRYLEAIARADGDVAADEQALLQRVQAGLGVQAQPAAA